MTVFLYPNKTKDTDLSVTCSAVRLLRDFGVRILMAPEYSEWLGPDAEYLPGAEGIAAAKARGVKFGRPPGSLPENFEFVYQQWKTGTITGVAAAEACGMPMSTFRYRADKYEQTGIL